MADSDDDDDDGVCIPVRPYLDEAASARRPTPRITERRAKRFQPRPPPERRAVERSSRSSERREETVASRLQATHRLQEAKGQSKVFAPAPRSQGMALSKFGVVDSSGKAVSSSSTAFASGGVPARQTKERKEGRSLELMDLAFPGGKRDSDSLPYAPISLPYVNFVGDDGEGGNDGEASASVGEKKSRPTMKHVDEKNTNAARELFLSPEGNLQEDHLLLLQLPSSLPELADPAEEVQQEGEDGKSAAAGASLLRYPDGKVGKLKIHKSGKVRMEIGGLPFCIDQGSATFFHQELACVCPLVQEMFGLGEIKHRVVLTPDLDAMFADIEREEAAAAAEKAPGNDATLAPPDSAAG